MTIFDKKHPIDGGLGFAVDIEVRCWEFNNVAIIISHFEMFGNSPSNHQTDPPCCCHMKEISSFAWAISGHASGFLFGYDPMNPAWSAQTSL